MSDDSFDDCGVGCLNSCRGVNSNFRIARSGLWHLRKAPVKPSQRINPIIDIMKRVTPKASQSCSVMISSFVKAALAGNDRITDQCISGCISMGMERQRDMNGQMGIQV
jgi:hypothetical protein